MRAIALGIVCMLAFVHQASAQEVKVAQAAANVVFPKSVSPAYAQEDEAKARMHTCVDQYNANKATGGNGGIKWLQEGGGYYSMCSERLKSASTRVPAPATPAPKVVVVPTQTSTNQPFSQAELDAMRARLASLWKLESVEHPEELYVTVRIRLNHDRRLAGAPQIVSKGSSPRYQAAADAAVRAVLQAQPYTMLRDETYDQWKFMDIDFDPKMAANAKGGGAPVASSAPFPFARWETNCRTFDTTWEQPKGSEVSDRGYLITSTVVAEHSDAMKLVDPGVVSTLVNFVTDGAKQFCQREIAAGRVDGPLLSRVGINVKECQPSSACTFFSAVSTGLEWKVLTNQFPQVLAAATAAAAQKQIAVDLRAKLQAASGYQEFVRVEDLSANPFRYKGKIIATQAMFSKMLSENEAAFGDLVVRGVPSTLFKDSENAILAIRVVGNTGPPFPVPLGEYVASYICGKFSHCEQFYSN